MTQSPYRSTEGHPMRRFALFAATLLIVIVVGSLPWNGRVSKSSTHSMCVCLPSRAGLILKSVTSSVAAFTKTQASKPGSVGTTTVSAPRVASQT
jgi:hypothetical protein